MSARSSAAGILFRAARTPGQHTVYSWWENGEIQSIEGDYAEVLKRYEKDRDALESKAATKKMVFPIFIFMAAQVVLTVWLVGRPLPIVSSLLLAVAGFLPLVSIAGVLGAKGDYVSQAAYEQFCRNHGAEHMVHNYYLRHRRRKGGLTEPWDLEQIRQCSVYNASCSTVLPLNRMIVLLTACAVIWNLPDWGPLKGALILLGVSAAVFVNWIFNPYNPLMAIQATVVAPPGDKELQLAIHSASQLLESIGEGTDQTIP